MRAANSPINETATSGSALLASAILYNLAFHCGNSSSLESVVGDLVGETLGHGLLAPLA
jgi:hypothetical protein